MIASQPAATSKGMTMRAFIITADDRPGMVASATEAAARAGVNLRGMAGIANGTTGMLALVGDDDTKLREALAAAGHSAREVELVTTEVPDRVGSAAELTRSLAAAGVSLEVLLPLGMSGSSVQVGLGATDAPALRRALGMA